MKNDGRKQILFRTLLESPAIMYPHVGSSFRIVSLRSLVLFFFWAWFYLLKPEGGKKGENLTEPTFRSFTCNLFFFLVGDPGKIFSLESFVISH